MSHLTWGYADGMTIGLMDSIKAVQPPGKWKIVIVDSKSTRILNAACKMYDILEENVSRNKLIIATLPLTIVKKGDT